MSLAPAETPKPAKAPAKIWTALELERALRVRFSAPEYAFLAQVRSGTGANFARTCDGLAMGVWPSRGLTLLGFEIKASRQDWIKELREPAKAERFCRFCDRWYLVVSDEKIVQPGELPATWGLMAPKNGRLTIRTEAPPLSPEPISRTFLASLMRHLNDASPLETALKQEATRAYQQGLAAGRAEAGRPHEMELRRVTSELSLLRSDVDQFEAASGVKIHRYQGQRVGAAVKWALGGGLTQAQREYLRLRDQLRALAATVEAIEHPEHVKEHPLG